MKKIILITTLSFCIGACTDKHSSDDPFVNAIIENGKKYNMVMNNEMITCMEERSDELNDEDKSLVLSVYDDLSPLFQSKSNGKKVTDAQKEKVVKKLTPEELKAFLIFGKKMLKPCKIL